MPSPEAKATGPIEAKSRISENLQKRIEAANLLSRKVKAREIFKHKLEQTRIAVKEIKTSGGDEWEDTNDYKVTLSDQYDRNKILVFSQKVLVADFLSFMMDRITEKIAALDDEILNTEI